MSVLLAGNGTEAEPFLVYTPDELNFIGLFPCEWNRRFRLMADLDLSGFSGVEFNVIGATSNLPFTGIFDGNHHRIAHFTYEAPNAYYTGLFGCIADPNAEVRDLGMVDPNVNAGSGDDVGAVAGALRCGTILNCWTERGCVAGGWCTGGLVGQNQAGTISNCYAAGSVIGDERVGGLVGSNYNGTISNSYSLSNVVANENAGGLVGYNKKTIMNCYTAATVTGLSVGGLVGLGFDSIVLDSFWDQDLSGDISSWGGTGKTTTEMMTAGTYLEAGWDFVGETENGTEEIWWIDEGTDYPRLWWEDTSVEF